VSNPSRAWLFTLNNPENNEVPNTLRAKFCTWQLETGEQGTPHLQGYCIFEKSTRLSALKKLLPTAHWERRQGTHEQAVEYCNKIDTRQQGPWTYGTAPAQGKRTDLIEVTDLIKAGTSLTQIAHLHSSTFVKFYRGITSLICQLTPPRTQETEVICYYGDTGTGKSYRAFTNWPDAYWLPQGKWFDNYIGQETVVIDEFYGWLPYSFILRLLDRYPLLVETKGGHVQFVSRRVVFTSNTPPWDWYKNVPNINAFKRRVQDKIYHVHSRTELPALIQWPVAHCTSVDTDQASRVSTFIPFSNNRGGNSITNSHSY